MERSLYNEMDGMINESLDVGKKAAVICEESLNTLRMYVRFVDFLSDMFGASSAQNFIESIARDHEEKSIVLVDKSLMKKIDQEIFSGKFRNRSHAIEYALAKFIESENKK